MHRVLVKYKHGSKQNPRPSTTTMKSLSVQGKSESAILAELRRTNPNYGDIVILSMDWK